MIENHSADQNSQRLNKFVALSLGVSRRTADELIENGQISINQKVASIGQRVKTGDTVIHKNQQISPKTHQLILLNKPVNYLCSRASQGGVPTIYELLPGSLHHLKLVGRLDKDSSGLILLTNDGELAHQMTHPSFYKIKRYLITLDAPLQPLHHQMINDYGVTLPDGNSKLSLERQHEGDDFKWIIRMSEGRNRQIRRTFLALGYTVTKLHRTDFGEYSLGETGRGEWRELSMPDKNTSA